MARLLRERPEVDIFESNFSVLSVLNGDLESNVFARRSRVW